MVLVIVVALLAVVAACSADGGFDDRVVEMLYADGDISCPDHWADDQSTTVGTVEYLPNSYGIEMTVALTAAAPYGECLVAVNTEEGACNDWEGTQQFEGLTTDGDGAGDLAFTHLAESGTHSVNVYVAGNRDQDVDDPKLREIGPGGFSEITVP